MNFGTTELKQYIDKIINEQADTSKAISQAYQKAITPLVKSIDISNAVQEAVRKSCADALTVNETLINSIRDVIIPYSKTIALSDELQEAISRIQPSVFESMNEISRSIPRLAEINASLSNSISSMIDIPPEDYVTINESTVHEIEIPEKLVLPLGNFRFKISTSLFVTILGVLVSIFLTVAMNIGGNDHSDSINTQNQVIIEQNQILMEPYKAIFDLLDSVDPSESSQADLINGWKESFLSESE